MKKEVKIGLAGIASLLILFFGFNYLKGINTFKPESYYYVEFSDINGLAKSSPVFANGFKIGIVRDIEYNFQNPGHVVVGVELDEAMKIPTGSHAELVTEMLGTVKMNLHFNLDSQTYYTEKDTLSQHWNFRRSRKDTASTDEADDAETRLDLSFSKQIVRRSGFGEHSAQCRAADRFT